MLVTVRQGDVGDVGERGGAAVRLFAKPVGSREAELGSKTQRLLLHIRLDRFVLYFDYIVLFFFDRNLRQSHFGHVSLIHSAKNSCRICVNPPAWSVLESK